MQFNDLSAGAEGENQPYYLPQVEEEVEISDNMAVISVPPPRFRPGDPAYILHDFNRVMHTLNTPHSVLVLMLNTLLIVRVCECRSSRHIWT